jgi:hypothetical protein
VSGTATTYTPPRGTQRLQINAADGAIFFVDCLLAPDLCSGGKLAPVAATGTLTRIENNFYWPITLRLGAQRTVSEQDSRLAYELYRSRDASLYRFWIALSVALAALAVWFGKRPLLSSASFHSKEFIRD